MTKPNGLKDIREKIQNLWLKYPDIFSEENQKYILEQFSSETLFSIKILSRLNLILQMSEYIVKSFENDQVLN